MESTNQSSSSASAAPSRSQQQRKGLTNSLLDAVFASIYANLTGGVFLTGFALLLGASAFQLGIIAALPFLANIFQLLGSYLVENWGHRKKFTVLLASGSMTIWAVIILLGLILFWLKLHFDSRWLILLLPISFVLASLAGLSWISWMSDLVPASIRGRYFGRRNMFSGLTGLIAAILAGQLLDLFHQGYLGFYLVFLIAILARTVSVYFLNRVPDLVPIEKTAKINYRQLLFKSWQNRNFRKYVIFAIIWGASFNLPGPFFAVYMIRDLHLNYSFLTLLTAMTALMDLLGQRYWGIISDRVGNRPVMLINGLITVSVPLVWMFTGSHPMSLLILLPIIHLYSGFSLAGFNLCNANLLFHLVPKKQNTVFFAVSSGATGLIIAIVTIVGGVIAKYVTPLTLFGVEALSGLKILFALSFLTRLLAIPFLLGVREMKETSVSSTIQVMISSRPLNLMPGFHPVLNYFILTCKSISKLDKRGLPLRALLKPVLRIGKNQKAWEVVYLHRINKNMK